jgi:NAD(P)-dependent dehydrogenase (short-subunit alcohol dehydrogenase family)
MAGRLQDRVAIVSGAGSSGPGWGNGKAAAVTYAWEGAKIVALDINIDAAQETASIIREEGGICLPIACDVIQPGEVEKAVASTIEEFGAIDVLHNNVGISKAETMESLSVENWDLILDTNLKSMFLTCRTVLPHMVRQRKSAIVNISSITALRYARRSLLAYGTSNAGVLGLTALLRLSTPRAVYAPIRFCLATSIRHLSGRKYPTIRNRLSPMSRNVKHGVRWAVWAQLGRRQCQPFSGVG